MAAGFVIRLDGRVDVRFEITCSEGVKRGVG